MSIKGLLRSIAFFLLFLITALFVALTYMASNDRTSDYQSDLGSLIVPTFTNQTIAFIPTYDGEKTLPFTAGAIIDIDGDGTEELFLGGGINQQDAIYRFVDNKFTDITSDTGWSKTTPDKTFSASSLDFDHDGDNDLLVTRQSGVFLYDNDNGSFTGAKLELELDPRTVPLSVAVADLNRDGLFDMYVSGYIARKHVEGETIFNRDYGGVSALFLNEGDGQFRNITKEAGLYYHHNTFMGVFIDVDNDQREDLIVAHDTGQVRTWKNLGGLKFENISNPRSDEFAYPMGIAVTDLKNDGLPDFFFSNVGSTVPMSLVRGDLRDDQTLHTDWLLFENTGDFSFKDSAEDAQVASYEFSWGAVFEDFNLDGRDDLVVSENYEGWPLHKLPMWRLDGRFFLQAENTIFMDAGKAAGVQNREYGITPLTADFNQDGYPDLIHINLLGEQKVFLSEAGDQGYLKVKLPNVIESVGAEVTVTLDDGNQIVQTFVVGEGLLSDQSHTLIFGLSSQQATSVSVVRLDGNNAERNGSFRNETLSF